MFIFAFLFFMSFSDSLSLIPSRFPLGMGQAGIGQGIWMQEAFAKDRELSSALWNCLNEQAVQARETPSFDTPSSGGARIRKVRGSGTAQYRLAVGCERERAKNLFEALWGHTSLQKSPWESSAQIETRFLASRRDFMPSHCSRLIRDHRGRERNYYWCDLYLNVADLLVGTYKPQ